MKRVCILLSCVMLLFFFGWAAGKGEKTEDLLQLIQLSNSAASQQEFIASLGKPVKIEEKSRRTWWYYDQGRNNVTVCWNNKDAQLERLDFKSGSDVKDTFNIKVSASLQSGKTELQEIVKLLGIPKSMVLKENRQEIHYVYNNITLRLFFRDRILMDYAVISQNNM